MATWDDLECSDSASDSDGEHANVALMADVDLEEEASISGPDSDNEEVFSNLSKEELFESLLEMFENYNLLKLKYKTLKRNLESESESLKTEIVELKKNNLKLEDDLKIA